MKIVSMPLLPTLTGSLGQSSAFAHFPKLHSCSADLSRTLLSVVRTLTPLTQIHSCFKEIAWKPLCIFTSQDPLASSKL